MGLLVRRCKMLNLILVASLILHAFPFTSAIAEDPIRVENVRFEVSRGIAIVHYDLVGPTDKKYKVSLLLKREDFQLFRYTPKNLTGDVGKGAFSGRNRQIQWDMLKEFPGGLEGTDYYFVVESEVASAGMKSLLWIGSAVVLGGGAAFFLLSKEEQASPAPMIGFPNPPGRPSGP